MPPLQVYLAAGTVYGLEGQLSELEDAARCIHSGTDETELADLEDQVIGKNTGVGCHALLLEIFSIQGLNLHW